MSRVTLSTLKSIGVPLVIFIFVFGVYLSNLYFDFRSGDYRKLLPSGDAVPNTFLPLAIINEHTFKFDELVQHLRRFDNWNYNPYYFVKLDGHYYSVYPPLTGIMTIPFYVIPLVLGKIPDIGSLYHLMKVLYLGRITASFYTAVSSVFVYFTLLKVSSLIKLKDTKLWAVLFTLFYALGTCSWSVSSRGLWQHTISEFFISIIVFLLLLAIENPKMVAWVGFVSGLAVLIRPTNIVLVMVMTSYVFIFQRKYFAKYILFAIPCVIFMLLYNYLIFGSPFMEGYGARSDFNWSTSLLVSIPGYLFSPARSFLFISPPLVLSYISIFLLFRNKLFGGKLNLLLRYLSVSFVLSFLMFSKWYTWDGSNGFGYRMLSDFLPILVVLSYIFVVSFFRKRRIAIAVILILVVYSAVIQFNAVNFLYSRCGGNHNWDFYCLVPRFL